MNKKIIILVIFTMGFVSVGYSIYKLYSSKDILRNLKNDYSVLEVDTIDSDYIDNQEKLEEYLLKDNYTNEEIEDYITSLTKRLELITNSNNDIINESNSLDSTLTELKEEYQIIYNNYYNATFRIDGILNVSQYPNYPTGCESVSLYIILKYYNVDVTIDNIVDNIRKGDLPYYENGKYYGGNPYLEFVGNPKDNSSFGTYENSIIEVANMYKPGIINASGTSLNDILNIVNQNRPVLVWISINLALPYINASWIYKPTGEIINWQANEHAVVIIGYNSNSIIASDPYTGIIKYYNRAVFEDRYNYFGKRAIYY